MRRGSIRSRRRNGCSARCNRLFCGGQSPWQYEALYINRAKLVLKAFGLSELDAVRYYTAMIMAEHGVISAPNMAVGQPFTMGQALPTVTLPTVTLPTGMTAPNTTPTPPATRATADGGKPRGLTPCASSCNC